MDRNVTLQVAKRTDTGKKATRRIRREGYVPANLYGRDEECENLQVSSRELESLVSQISIENTLVELEMEGRKGQTVLIRELQTHPVRQRILHVDFLHIRAGEKVRISVPIRLTGSPLGVRNAGGILQQNRHEAEIECLPREIPESFDVDVSEMEIGDVVHLADVATGGVTLLDEQSLTVCTVVPPTAEEVVEEEEEVDLEGAEPEVITARGDDDAEEEEEQAD